MNWLPKIGFEVFFVNEKQVAGEKAAEFIQNGMLVGLGTGSTVYYSIRRIAELVREGVHIVGVSTSKSTTELAQSLGIELVSINDIGCVDITIDGADEVDEDFNGIKGGGGALFFEKIVAHASKRVIWVVDSSKMVKRLGKSPLQIEVSPIGYKQVYSKLKLEGMGPVLRLISGKPFLTDSNNYIIDLHSAELNNPTKLAGWLKEIPGIIEHGLFINYVDQVIVGRGDSAEIISSTIRGG
ncbi:ribose-5-phosphate isomerase RpiA [Desulfitobacterium sp. THU1]|uniref:ribose-5-phosphate isomerase RpiA n=1 Tax=Desulfitobacterium sp. THU1 TaxID=3138072 RepID=UPI00311F583C